MVNERSSFQMAPLESYKTSRDSRGKAGLYTTNTKNRAPIFCSLTWANQTKESCRELLTTEERQTLCPTTISLVGSISSLLLLLSAVLILSKSQTWREAHKVMLDVKTF